MKPMEEITEKLAVVTPHIPLQGVYNCRDLGGLETVDGKRIRPGLIFRSSDLHQATDQDLVELNGRGVKNVVDLRNEWEIVSKPDQLYYKWKLDHEPVLHEHNITDTEGNPIRFAYDFYTDAKKVMTEIYKAMLLDKRAIQTWKALFRLLLEEEGILYHCTEGKDRTGIASILIESALGVKQPLIYEDYLETNLFAQDLIRMHMERDEKIPFVGKALEKSDMYFFEADPAYFQMAEETVRPYGGFTGYLKEVIGLNEQQLEELKSKYLENNNG